MFISIGYQSLTSYTKTEVFLWEETSVCKDSLKQDIP